MLFGAGVSSATWPVLPITTVIVCLPGLSVSSRLVSGSLPAWIKAGFVSVGGIAWPIGTAEAGVSMKKCRCPEPSAAGEPAGASCQFATATSTLTFGPFTVAPSAGDTIVIDGVAPPPQADNTN